MEGNAMSHDDIAVFAPKSGREFGERVCSNLGISLSAHEEREFEDGEHKTRPLESVRGKDVFVIHSLYGDADQSVNDKLIRFYSFWGHFMMPPLDASQRWSHTFATRARIGGASLVIR